MIRAILYWEVDQGIEIGPTVDIALNAVAAAEAAKHGYSIENRQETKSDDGHRVILVWNLK